LFSVGKLKQPKYTPFSPLPYSYLDTIPNLNRDEIMSQAQHKDGSGTSAFRQYVRHFRPKKKLNAQR
jgi:hypothetical protein